MNYWMGTSLKQKVMSVNMTPHEQALMMIQDHCEKFTDPLLVYMNNGAIYCVYRTCGQIGVLQFNQVDEGHQYEIGLRLAVLEAIEIYNNGSNKRSSLKSTLREWLYENGGL